MQRLNPGADEGSDNDFPNDDDVPVNPATVTKPKIIASTEELLKLLAKAPTETRRFTLQGLTIEATVPTGASNVTVATYGVRIVPRQRPTTTEVLNTQRTREGLNGQQSENRESVPEAKPSMGLK
jgi:hypothetical protein